MSDKNRCRVIVEVGGLHRVAGFTLGEHQRTDFFSDGCLLRSQQLSPLQHLRAAPALALARSTTYTASAQKYPGAGDFPGLPLPNVSYSPEGRHRSARRRCSTCATSKHRIGPATLADAKRLGELGFDESRNWGNSRPRPSNSKLFQNGPELLAKSVEGPSRLPNIDYAPAARHRPGNVREHPFDRPVSESLPPPLQDHLDAFFVLGS